MSETKDEFGYADAWRPAAGDTLRGKVVDLDTGHSGYGSYPIVTIKSEEGGRFAVHGFHTALRNRLAAIRPSIGDRLSIRFDGDVTPKSGGQQYKGYSVTSPDKKASPSFWDNHTERNTAAPADDLDLEDIPF